MAVLHLWNPPEKVFKKCQSVRCSYLSNQEVHIFLDEHIQLFSEDGLHICLALAAQVRWSLGHSSSSKSITLIGNLTG